MQAVVVQFAIGDAVVAHDMAETDMNFLLVVLRIDIDRRSWFGH